MYSRHCLQVFIEIGNMEEASFQTQVHQSVINKRATFQQRLSCQMLFYEFFILSLTNGNCIESIEQA